MSVDETKSLSLALAENISMEIALTSAEFCLRDALHFLDDAFARNETVDRKAFAAVEAVLEDGLESLSTGMVELSKVRDMNSGLSESQIDYVRRHREERRESYRKAARAAGL